MLHSVVDYTFERCLSSPAAPRVGRWIQRLDLFAPETTWLLLIEVGEKKSGVVNDRWKPEISSMRTDSIEADRSVSFFEGMVEVAIYEQARILPGGGGH